MKSVVPSKRSPILTSVKNREGGRHHKPIALEKSLTRSHRARARLRAKILDAGLVRRAGAAPAGTKRLAVTVKESPGKGNGLFATRLIPKGRICAYYHVKVFSWKNKRTKFEKGMYSLDAYTKNARLRKDIYLDLFPGSVVKPYRGIPHWGHIANEDKNANAELIWGEEGYRAKTVRAGDKVRLPLVTTRAIRKGEEICWYYGAEYPRDYTCETPKNW